MLIDIDIDINMFNINEHITILPQHNKTLEGTDKTYMRA